MKAWRRARVRGAARAGVATVVLAAASALAGCALTEVGLVDPEDVIVAEAHVVLTLRPGGPGDPAGGVEMTMPTLLHRTYGDGPDVVRGAVVRVAGASGRVVQLVEGQDEDCLVARPGFRSTEYYRRGTCYGAPAGAVPFEPGEQVSLEVRTSGGQLLTAASRIPGAFALAEPLGGAGGACRVEPDANHIFGWTTPQDVWTYVAETEVAGLRAPLAERGIESPPDTLYMLGLAIGREENHVVFPRQLGVLELLGDGTDADVLVALQDGLPDGVRATFSVSAVDQNWANWSRGGNFNPSGLVRVSSVFGDGAGVFGTAVQLRADVVAGPAGNGQPPLCGSLEAGN